MRDLKVESWVILFNKIHFREPHTISIQIVVTIQKLQDKIQQLKEVKQHIYQELKVSTKKV
jgi:hypothetical protein